MLLAGLDGVQNKIHPGDPIDKDMYHLPPEEAAKVPHVCASLEEALNAITNPGTNSYKRLVPGFEAPINLAYSAKNRSASIRIPFVSSPKARRIEVRFPDPTCNSYLAFSAMLLAGLDGVQNKIHPGDPIDKNLYDLPPEEAKKVPNVCSSLEQALSELNKDRAFLTKGGVFSDDMLDAYIDLKMEEVTMFRMTTHPVEYAMYYSL